ncbi:hypothetical protein [Neoroseomonas soli]|uniref:Uncharacterized protein n=1 Tax=Neoroseomonas soli TaxID=1081025 RepID=A0A9X9WTU8_9PROT|nr:hypothetical protein [Neoroseomonas soli]MBR0670577.1 hypothetical protein [Neoroseomonas soli]
MAPTTRSDQDQRRRRSALRSLGIASGAAFAGGVAVVGVQYALGLVSAGYPPVVQALLCEAEGGHGAAAVALASDLGSVVPVIEFAAGSTVACRIDAPGADYATWSVVGPAGGTRSGPIDSTLPCQSPEDFANQDTSTLRLSACQRMRVERPGLHLLSVTVMLRGQHATDRARMVIRVMSEAVPAPATPGPRRERLQVTLRLPPMETEDVREADLSASFGEHGLVPQGRAFERTVYRLASAEEFVSATFRVRSAANASAVRVAYVPQTRTVTATFTLRSGSIIDRWRGWVSGTVAITVRRQEQAREVELPEADLAVPGRADVPLPEGLDANRARILLRRPETATAIEVGPGGTAQLDRARISARISNGTLVLEAGSE